RYLSTGWVVWGHARQLTPGIHPELLAALGAALLRAGDDAAAALAAGYSDAERHLAARAGATRRAIVDELLDTLPLDPAAAARLAQRAALVGLDPATIHRLMAIRSDEAFEDEAGPVEEVTRLLARTPGRKSHLVAPRQGDLFIVLADPWPAAASLAEVRTVLDGLASWWAVSSRPVAVTALGEAAAEARAGLDIVRRLGRSGEVVPLASIALDRALAADQRLLEDGVAAWVGPLLAAPRGGEALVATVEAWLAAGQSVAGAGRALGLGARTVSYRLERIAALLDRPRLDPDARLHLAAALLGRRLVERPPL
ncbi:MAG: helix-turn-helix domain-containing protein, partial [Candidatus Limnocylindrales bacterium]